MVQSLLLLNYMLSFKNLVLVVKGQKTVYIFMSYLEVAVPLFLFAGTVNWNSGPGHNNY